MEKTKDILKYETVLPEDFDGVFRFTNWTDEDFTGTWGSKDYIYPANSTSPMVIPNQTPLEVQQIRKLFAKKLAEREFFKSQKYGNLIGQERNNDGSPRLNSINMAGTYSLDDLTPFIKRCLESLPQAKAKVQEAKKTPIEAKLTRNEEGELNTEAIDQRVSLRKRALEA